MYLHRKWNWEMWFILRAENGVIICNPTTQDLRIENCKFVYSLGLHRQTLSKKKKSLENLQRNMGVDTTCCTLIFKVFVEYLGCLRKSTFFTFSWKCIWTFILKRKPPRSLDVCLLWLFLFFFGSISIVRYPNHCCSHGNTLPHYHIDMVYHFPNL